MSVYFYKLFDLMARKNLKKKELAAMAGIARVTMTKIANNRTVQTDTIGKLCRALDCQPGDIMEYIEEPDAPEEAAQETQTTEAEQ